MDGQILILYSDSGQDNRYTVQDLPGDEEFVPDVTVYYRITDPDMIEEAILFKTEISNRITMDDNKEFRRTQVNSGRFGQGKVYKNFSPEAVSI